VEGRDRCDVIRSFWKSSVAAQVDPTHAPWTSSSRTQTKWQPLLINARRNLSPSA
jgi:hypothetical protein